jgi:hypothetical protein
MKGIIYCLSLSEARFHILDIESGEFRSLSPRAFQEMFYWVRSAGKSIVGFDTIAKDDHLAQKIGVLVQTDYDLAQLCPPDDLLKLARLNQISPWTTTEGYLRALHAILVKNLSGQLLMLPYLHLSEDVPPFLMRFPPDWLDRVTPDPSCSTGTTTIWATFIPGLTTSGLDE